MKSFRVMVVEDDGPIREAVRDLLEMEGIMVETAVHGRDGLNKLTNGLVPQLILLDLNMPVMPGKEFLEHLRNGPHASIPVVVMTAVPDANVTDVARILRKPMDLEEVLRVVGSFR